MPTILPPRSQPRVSKKRAIFSAVFNGLLVVSAAMLAVVVLLQEQRYIMQRGDQFVGSVAQISQPWPTPEEATWPPLPRD